MLTVLISALILAFVYRLRGGGFVTLGGDSECRALWGWALALTYMITTPFSVLWLLGPWIFVMGWVGETIPHGFAQNMGRRGASWYNVPLSKRWPGIVVIEPTQEEFPKAPYAWLFAADFMSMAIVGGLRALLVLSASIGYGLATHNRATLYGVALAVAWRVIWQPVAYTLGWLVPLTLPSLAARSTEWAEFLDGLGWGVVWLIAGCV